MMQAERPTPGEDAKQTTLDDNVFKVFLSEDKKSITQKDQHTLKIL